MTAPSPWQLDTGSYSGQFQLVCGVPEIIIKKKIGGGSSITATATTTTTTTLATQTSVDARKQSLLGGKRGVGIGGKGGDTDKQGESG